MMTGFVLIAIGILLSSWFRNNLSKPRHNIPFAFRNPIFVTVGSIFWIGLILGGTVLTFLSSLSTGILTLFILAALWFLLSKMGGTEQIAKVMTFSYHAMRSKYPNENEQAIFTRVLKTRYPAWDEERLQMFISDCESIDDLIKRVVYHETGKWPGVPDL